MDYLAVDNFFYFEEMTEHVINDDHTSNGSKHYFVEFNPHRKAAKRQTCIFEPLLVSESKIYVLIF